MKLIHSTAILSLAALGSAAADAQAVSRPNVIMIITDDQGFGDLSFNGNPHVRTTAIDALARQSIRFTNFYVCPVSAPTRAGLMTGRYSLRTGVHDTYNGGAVMHTGEVTIAEMLKAEGYSTAIFGKWHLGDSYPCRPIDQGFDESVVHLGGGMGQPGDFTTWPRGDSSYFDPVLWHNGSQEKYHGYCSDIFASEALKFIDGNARKPFFCYLSFNAPHTPLQVPKEYYEQFRNTDPASGFGKDKRPFPAMNENNREDARKIYAMVKNIDDKVRLVLDKLDKLNISGNTIVIFLTDNGPQQPRYNAGMRGLKSSVYRGGVRVPLYIRYPEGFKGNRDIDEIAANIDLMPTIAELCGGSLPRGREIDGQSLVPLLAGKQSSLQPRSLFFYWTRKYPELYNNIALQKGSYRLVGNTAFNSGIEEFELYDISSDPWEQKNIISSGKDLALKMKTGLDSLFTVLVNSPNLISPQRIILGSMHENPVYLNRNDAEGDRGVWAQDEVFGRWRVSITEGTYDIKFIFASPLKANGQMIVETGTFINQVRNKTEGIKVIEMKGIKWPDLDCDLIPFYQAVNQRIFPFIAEIRRTDL